MARASKMNRGYGGGLAAGAPAGTGFQSSFQSSMAPMAPPAPRAPMAPMAEAAPMAPMASMPAPAQPPPVDFSNMFSPPPLPAPEQQSFSQPPPSPFGPAPLPFGGFRQEGGPVQPGLAYIVGEAGPELIGFERADRAPPAGARFMRAGGNWGGFFVMSRATYDRIGGWVDHAYWGYNDPSLIMKAWLCGVDTICDASVIYKHMGKVKTGFGYPVRALHPLLNVLHTYATVFEDATLQRWLPLFETHHKWMIKQGMAHVSTAAMATERRHFQALRRRSDEEFFNVFLPARGFNGEVWHA